MNIHEKIASLRKAAGLTQEKLGATLGVSPQAVSKWEKAECLPDLTLIPRLCEALHVTADELLDIPPQTADKGTALVTADCLRICTPGGISMTVTGAEAVQTVQHADTALLQELLADADALRILRAIGFTATSAEDTLAAQCGLSPEATHAALFRLLRLEMCQFTPDGYVLGANAYLAYAALAAAHLLSPSGRAEVSSITTSYTN